MWINFLKIVMNVYNFLPRNARDYWSTDANKLFFKIKNFNSTAINIIFKASFLAKSGRSFKNIIVPPCREYLTLSSKHNNVIFGRCLLPY